MAGGRRSGSLQIGLQVTASAPVFRAGNVSNGVWTTTATSDHHKVANPGLATHASAGFQNSAPRYGRADPSAIRGIYSSALQAGSSLASVGFSARKRRMRHEYAEQP